MRHANLFLCTLVFLVALGSHADQNIHSSFVAAAWDKAALTATIETERPAFEPPKGVGLTAPHHLLAADLVARGFC